MESITDKKIMYYMLGKLSENEQATLEKSFISNPQIFAQVVDVENDLIDDYVRGHLTPGEREGFEQYFLTNPSRRQRVQIAEALSSRFGQAVTTSGIASTTDNRSVSRRLLAQIRILHTAPGLIAALATLLFTLGGAWLFNETRRLAQEVRVTRTEGARRERELTQQIADERRRNSQLAGEIERLRNLPIPQIAPSRSSSTPAIATLFLLGGALRDTGTGAIPRLIISPGLEQVRIVFKMEDGGYQKYRAELQSESGELIWRQGVLKPRLIRSVATFTITLPISKFTGGSYTFTISGVNKSGGLDTLSKSSFRVEKQS